VRIDETTVRVGIHIAAPTLGVQRNDGFDAIARARMSTVYMPGDKITMLPDSLVDTYTLGAGQTRPAVSLYATVNTLDWTVLATETKVEAIPMVSNLRHNELDSIITEENLANDAGDYPHKADIAVLWKWAQVLEAGRMQKRESFGLKPEQNNRVDFNFYVEDDVVSIVRRKRGAPLDKLVAELMIFANSTWGKLLHDHGIPGIYRAQGGGSGGWNAKMQVRMVTHAAPHQGLGVDQYAWSTSPLRRYTDLVNQWQIIACVQHGVTAPLVATFKPKDADLFAIVSGFDSAYSNYGDFQNNMERYWCLRWLGQEKPSDGMQQVDAVVLKDDVLRLVEIPLIIRMPGLPKLARGAQVRLEILRWDELDLSVEARLLETLTTVSDEGLDEAALDELEESLTSEENLDAVTDNAELEFAENSVEVNTAIDLDVDIQTDTTELNTPASE
jgi:exoribonuclease-2